MWPLFSKRRPTLGTAYDGWLDRALAKAPEKRFSSAKEMASAFRDCLAASIRRSPRMLILGGAILGGLCATIAAIALSQRSPPPSDPAKTSPAPSSAPFTDQSPVVNPVGPAPTLAPIPSVPSPARPPAAAQPTATAAATPPVPSVEPTATASAATPKTAPTSKPRLPPKEFDPSEIQ